MKRVIGVDAGGSKTLALLVNEHGIVAARARAGGSNPRSLGRERAALALGEALTPLLSAGDVCAICIGAAGIDRQSDREFFEAELRKLAGSKIALVLCTDAQIVLRAGTEKRPAMAVIAGTGSLVYGETAGREGIRCGGYGALIGDDASAYVLGLASIKHCARVLDGLEQRSTLTEAVLSATNAQTLGELIDRIHHWPPDVGAIAALAPLVGEAAERGDKTARTLVTNAAARLSEEVAFVASQIRTASVLPIVISGGAFDAVPELIEAARSGGKQSGECEVLRPALEPAHGAALLAFEAVGLIQTLP